MVIRQSIAVLTSNIYILMVIGQSMAYCDIYIYDESDDGYTTIKDNINYSSKLFPIMRFNLSCITWVYFKLKFSKESVSPAYITWLRYTIYIYILYDKRDDGYRTINNNIDYDSKLFLIIRVNPSYITWVELKLKFLI